MGGSSTAETAEYVPVVPIALLAIERRVNHFHQFTSPTSTSDANCNISRQHSFIAHVASIEIYATHRRILIWAVMVPGHTNQIDCCSMYKLRGSAVWRAPYGYWYSIGSRAVYRSTHTRCVWCASIAGQKCVSGIRVHFRVSILVVHLHGLLVLLVPLHSTALAVLSVVRLSVPRVSDRLLLLSCQLTQPVNALQRNGAAGTAEPQTRNVRPANVAAVPHSNGQLTLIERKTTTTTGRPAALRHRHQLVASPLWPAASLT